MIVTVNSYSDIPAGNDFRCTLTAMIALGIYDLAFCDPKGNILMAFICRNSKWSMCRKDQFDEFLLNHSQSCENLKLTERPNPRDLQDTKQPNNRPANPTPTHPRRRVR